MADARRSSIVSWTAVAAILGAMMSVQYHDVLLGGADLGIALPGMNTVEARLAAVTAFNRGLRIRLNRLERAAVALQDRAVRRGGAVAALARNLHAARILTGSVALTGPGVSVTIDDGRMSGIDRERFLTHDWDLRSVVNELFLAGADAVAVNGARVTDRTGIFCIGPLVRVGPVRLGPPFVVRAIGDPHLLAAALNLPGGVLDALKSANRGLFVSRPAIEKRVYIPAYHAQPTGAGDA